MVKDQGRIIHCTNNNIHYCHFFFLIFFFFFFASLLSTMHCFIYIFVVHCIFFNFFIKVFLYGRFLDGSYLYVMIIDLLEKRNFPEGKAIYKALGPYIHRRERCLWEFGESPYHSFNRFFVSLLRYSYINIHIFSVFFLFF